MLGKKIKLELKVVIGLGKHSYDVKKVTNSIEWAPGEVLDINTVKNILKRNNTDVVITGQ